MHLTNDEEKILAGEQGVAARKAMELLVRLGEIYGAEKMIPVKSVQVSGVSYKSIGDPGLEFLQGFADEGAKVKVPTTLNPTGMDLNNWEKYGFPAAFAKKQKKIIDAFRSMGITISATCTPYYAGNTPKLGEHIAWGESSAVSFANSVLGARTNREGGPSALAAAIIGKVGMYGLHLEENRKPHFVVKVNAELKSYSDYGLLGNHIGRIVKNKIPYFYGLCNPKTDYLKGLGAAMAASGAVALYHVDGVTPEASAVKDSLQGLETIEVEDKDLQDARERLMTGTDPELIIIGCPHCSLAEVRYIADKLDGKKLKKEFWVCM